MLKKIVSSILIWEARAVLRRYQPCVIAITGSVGKTTTKDAIFAALSEHLHVRKSEKSFNSEIGVPLTILGLDNAWRNPFKWLWNIIQGLILIARKGDYPQWLILEVGADRPGDIRSIAQWLRPDIVVITSIPEIPVHVEYFDSPEALLREKRALAEYLKPGGKLIINGDDARMQELRSTFHGVTTTYGSAPTNDYSASHEEIIYEDKAPVGIRFRVNHAGNSIPVTVHGALGRPRVYAALAALAAASAAGVDIVSASSGLAAWVPAPGRMRLLPGLRGSIIIDDTYNSSPAAALAALDTLASIQNGGKKIAVLGDMLELGKYSAGAHRTVGERAAQCTDMLATVGFRARAIGEAALDAGMPDINVRKSEQNESVRAGKELEPELQEGDIVLIKGSQSMRMEKTVLEIKAEPEKASELLVRQDPEWLDR
ncbi:UDP-N-acetylmuramoyl-tripeptide--D-alanyl-D-alanine ligase [Candidatus Kaiserbacteria bacterium]|nr:UDP-N-acetylmuramoyl-tripeptide--D-alanyl-D-alanine ligase [Candidatus Kaiserbacteria bacterium]